MSIRECLTKFPLYRDLNLSKIARLDTLLRNSVDEINKPAYLLGSFYNYAINISPV